MSGHGELQDREARGAAVMHPWDGDLMAATVVAIVAAIVAATEFAATNEDKPKTAHPTAGNVHL